MLHIYTGNGSIFLDISKQGTIAQSTIEAEYIAACEAVNKAIWRRKIKYDIGKDQGGATAILCDSDLAIEISRILHFIETQSISK